MSTAEWRNVKNLLKTGWVAAGEVINDDAWEYLLRDYSYDEVKTALTSLLGRSKFRPTPSEIAGLIPRESTVTVYGSEVSRPADLQAKFDAEDAALDAERELPYDEQQRLYAERVTAAANKRG